MPEQLNQPKIVLVIAAVFVALFILGAIADAFGAWSGIKNRLASPESENNSTNVSQVQPTNTPYIIEKEVTVEVTRIVEAEKIALPTSTTQMANSTTAPLPTHTSVPLQPTHTPVPQPIATAVIIEQPISSSSNHTCVPSEYTFLGDSWVSAATFIPTIQGETKIFSHCPPSASVQYNSIAIDDEISRVERVCSQSKSDITHFFESYSETNELLPHYRSSSIDLTPDCRIDFVIKDITGVNIGLMIKSSGP